MFLNVRGCLNKTVHSSKRLNPEKNVENKSMKTISNLHFEFEVTPPQYKDDITKIKWIFNAPTRA